MGTANVTMREIINAANVMRELTRDKVSGKLALRMARFARALDSELESFNGVSKAVFDRYAEVPEPEFDKKGKRTNSSEPMIPKNKEAEFNAEIDSMLDERVEVAIPWLTEGDIESFDKINTNSVYQLLPFLESQD